MADKKISALPAATTPLGGTEVLPIVQGGTTDKVSVENLTKGRAVEVTRLLANGAFDANPPSTSSVPIVRVNEGGALSLWIGAQGYTNVWLQAIQDDGSNNIKELVLQPLGGPATLRDGNFILGTAGKGITTGGATALGLGVNGTVDAVTIDASKNVGIGTTSYVGKLSVSLGNATSFGAPPTWDNTYAVFGGTTANAAAVGIGFNSGIGGSITALSPGLAWHPMSYLAADHRFILAGTEAMRLDSAGNLGINETAPDYKLDVNGSFGFTPGASVTPVDNGDVVFELTNNTTLTVKAKGSDGVVRSATLTLT